MTRLFRITMPAMLSAAAAAIVLWCAPAGGAPPRATPTGPDEVHRPNADAGRPAEQDADKDSNSEGRRERILRLIEDRLDHLRQMQAYAQRMCEALSEAAKEIRAGADPEEVWRKIQRESAPDSRPGPGHRRPRPEHPGAGVPDGPPPPQPPEGGDGAAPDPSYPPATAEQKRRIDMMLESVFPGLGDHLHSICQRDPQRCEREYAKLAYKMRDLIKDGTEDEALFRLRLEEMRTSAQVVFAAREVVRLERSSEQEDATNLAAARQKLEDLVSTQFDLRMEIRKREVDSLKQRRAALDKQINEKSDELDQQRTQRDQVIADQIDQYIQKVRDRFERFRRHWKDRRDRAPDDAEPDARAPDSDKG